MTRSIIAKTEHWSAADVFQGLQGLTSLRAAARLELAKIDLLVVPTAAYNYTVREIMAEEDEQDYVAMMSGKAMVTKNAKLGSFTNFVNLLDMCGVSVFSGLLKLGPGAEGSGTKKARKADGAAAAPPSTSAVQRTEHLAATGSPNAVVPFGITLLAPAWTDAYVAAIATAYEKASGLSAGPLGHGVKPYRTVGTVRPRKSSLSVGTN